MDRERLRALLERYQWVLLVLLVGVLLLLWPMDSNKKSKQPEEPVSAAQEVVFDLPALEAELSETLSHIKGVGNVDVVLTLSSGGRRILAQDQSVGEHSRETTTVVLSSGSSQQSAVTVEVLYPTFQGALVVCDGGDSPTVRLALVQAVGALTGLKADQISVCASSTGS